MIMDRYFKIVLAFVAVVLWSIFFKLWLSPQNELAQDMDIERRLSYISKIVGAIESSVIKMEGDLRFIKRQTQISVIARDLSEKKLNTLEVKITGLESLLDSIEMDVAEIGGNISYIENDIDGLASGSCDNIFLCRQTKY